MHTLPGIDTIQGNFVEIIKLNILSNRHSDVIQLLKAVGSSLKSICLLPSPLHHREEYVRNSNNTTAIIGFSARFFKGPLNKSRDSSFRATRFNISMPVPSSLRKMNLRGDERFQELCTNEKIGEKESDLIIIIESNDETTANKSFKTLLDAIIPSEVEIKKLQNGYVQHGGFNPLGYKDHISNLQDIKRAFPEQYRKYVYAHNGEAGSHIYDGSTYLVYRKYQINTNRWFNSQFSIQDSNGKNLYGSDAHNLVIGRDKQNSLVIDKESRVQLQSQFDEKQSVFAFNESHIRQANPRGFGLTNFGAKVKVRDARILRRGFSYFEHSHDGNEIIEGMFFFCFQSNIQERGFEFIHNEWLMSKFMGNRDHLLDPDTGVIEPLDGCYYFVPLVRNFPGDLFFSV